MATSNSEKNPITITDLKTDRFQVNIIQNLIG